MKDIVERKRGSFQRKGIQEQSSLCFPCAPSFFFVFFTNKKIKIFYLVNDHPYIHFITNYSHPYIHFITNFFMLK